ncbi:hypothetical protein NFIA_073880 [Paecilomyces variotii No. 5]|uniref:SUN domain-containing protein n=1 Tax=Byssochlamys spectabilis (strain No. 5 / NBRC 109023) TaxID=1356009 RepID=V5FTZ2_BYSSN|nr:hypothetical protein NFIA_073880 [Paecilomyces variotii No. 5]
MPPKRTSGRRAGSVISNHSQLAAGLSSPDVFNPGLPSIRSKQSFAYGSSKTPALPRELGTNVSMGISDMAETIDVGLRQANERETTLDANPRNRNQRMTTRSQTRSVSRSPSPVARSTRRSAASKSPGRRRGRPRREPTPDQQLLDALREETQSPSPSPPKLSTILGSDDNPDSTAPPTPPVAHTLSTDTTPVRSTFHSGQQTLQPGTYPRLDPTPGRFRSSLAQDASALDLSRFETSSVDNMSTVSWNLEREIHDAELQRTTENSTYTGRGPQGRTITAPPKRPSGLSFSRDIVDEESEESEPSSNPTPSSSSSSSPEPQHEHEPVPEPDLEPVSEPRREEPEPVPEVQPSPKPAREPTPQPKHEDAFSTAPARTIIPHTTFREPSTDDASTISEQPFVARTVPLVNIRASEIRLPRISINWNIVFAMAGILAAVVASYAFGDRLVSVSRSIGSAFDFGNRVPYSVNVSESEFLSRISGQVERLGTQVSSISREVNSMRSEWNKGPAYPITSQQPVALVPAEPPRVNFLSPGTGAVIDPYMTSPTSGRGRSFLGRLFFGPLKDFPQGVRAPVTALMPWDGLGDCWCSVPRDGLSQLSVILGRQVVPEEVVVEHIPKDASLEPEVAPRDMELWVRYVFNQSTAVLTDPSVPNASPSSVLGSFMGRWFSSSSSTTRDSSPALKLSTHLRPSSSSLSSLHDMVLETLRQTYPHDAETSYWDDALLGPSFYRVGKWQYNIDSEDHIQHFSLDAIMDIPGLRVDKVVFRVSSNWGGHDTCIYRLRLYGHL